MSGKVAGYMSSGFRLKFLIAIIVKTEIISGIVMTIASIDPNDAFDVGGIANCIEI